MRASASLIVAILVAGTSAAAWLTQSSPPQSRPAAPAPAPAASAGITAVPGIRVGHVTLDTRPTGCTVILAPPNTTGAVDERGGAPATIDTGVVRPENIVDVVHAIVLAGGSAYGLDTATGVRNYLGEQKIGFEFGGSYVPIILGAALFDLPVGGHPEIRPDATCGYQAAKNAKSGSVAEGSVGAGAGATVGKFGALGRAMKGGIGTASITMPNGLIIGAVIAVNAFGTVVDPFTGKPIAGVRAADGKTLEDPHALLRRGPTSLSSPMANTTIGVIATNAKLTKAQALKVAQMAHDGLARAIVPAHTPNDGDTLFTLATGTWTSTADVGQIGALAAEVVADAIVRAVTLAHGLPGYPSVTDIR